MPTPRPNPYAAFRDDRERRLALRSRDVRIVLVTLIVAVASVATAFAPAAWQPAETRWWAPLVRMLR